MISFNYLYLLFLENLNYFISGNFSNSFYFIHYLLALKYIILQEILILSKLNERYVIILLLKIILFQKFQFHKKNILVPSFFNIQPPLFSHPFPINYAENNPSKDQSNLTLNKTNVDNIRGESAAISCVVRSKNKTISEKRATRHIEGQDGVKLTTFDNTEASMCRCSQKRCRRLHKKEITKCAQRLCNFSSMDPLFSDQLYNLNASSTGINFIFLLVITCLLFLELND